MASWLLTTNNWYQCSNCLYLVPSKYFCNKNIILTFYKNSNSQHRLQRFNYTSGNLYKVIFSLDKRFYRSKHVRVPVHPLKSLWVSYSLQVKQIIEWSNRAESRGNITVIQSPSLIKLTSSLFHLTPYYNRLNNVCIKSLHTNDLIS